MNPRWFDTGGQIAVLIACFAAALCLAALCAMGIVKMGSEIDCTIRPDTPRCVLLAKDAWERFP